MTQAVSKAATFDFEAAKRRLEQGLEQQEEAAHTREIFAERARRLAQEAHSADQHAEKSHLAFSVQEVRFCAALTSIRAVFVPARVAVIPGAPVHLAQVIHFDGRIVSLLDLPPFLGLVAMPQASGKVRQVVLLESRGVYLGCLVDEIRGLFPVDTQKLVPSRGNGSDFIMGIGDEMTLVLDAPRLIGGLMQEDQRARAHAKETP